MKGKGSAPGTPPVRVEMSKKKKQQYDGTFSSMTPELTRTSQRSVAEQREGFTVTSAPGPEWLRSPSIAHEPEHA
jgi:hypothetical protein